MDIGSSLVRQATKVVMRENACGAETARSRLAASAAVQRVPVEEVAMMILTIQGCGRYPSLAAAADSARPR